MRGTVPFWGAVARKNRGGGANSLCSVYAGMKTIYIRADDGGSRVEADLAILECVWAGAVKNVSVLATGDTFAEFVGWLKFLRMQEAEFAVGLHFCLTSEWPDIPKRAASEALRMVFPGELPRDFGDRRWEDVGAEIITQELRAQYERFIAAGLVPDYLDGHMGSLEGYWLRGNRRDEFQRAVLDFAKETALRNVDLLPRVAVSAENLAAGTPVIVEVLKHAEDGAVWITHPCCEVPSSSSQKASNDRRMVEWRLLSNSFFATEAKANGLCFQLLRPAVVPVRVT